MKRDEVFQFLQLVNYEEILPLNDGTAQFKETAKYCRKKGLITITPDNNCIISRKGLDLQAGKIQLEELSLPVHNAPFNRKPLKLAYRLSGAALGVLLVYELVIKGLMH